MPAGLFDRFLENVRQRLSAFKEMWIGASIALLLVGALFWGLFTWGYFLSQPHWLTASIAFIVGCIAACVVALAAIILYALLNIFPRSFLWAAIVSVLLMVNAFDGFSLETNLFMALYLLPAIALFGGALGLLFSKGYKRIYGSIVLAVSTLYLGYIAQLILSDGSGNPLPFDASSIAKMPLLDMPNPSLKGPHHVRKLYYGSGKDYYRPFYGAQVDIVTQPVDGTPFVDQWTGLAGAWRTYYWGFDPSKLPLNAMVWYPDGEGPFPLFLIVHGNTMMERYSEGGYAYLGELLASRGYIVASVDENFFNSSWHNLWQGIAGNNGRAWVMLEHLKLWRKWNEDPSSPFFQKVDMERIALGGHSRGGEAIALAASFNRLPYYPDDCNIAFDYHFNIRSLVAISPVDGQFQPTGRGNQLKDIHYLVLHGCNDADVEAFQGSAQYERISFSPNTDWLKASVYIFGANHGQFNSLWGRYDLWPLEAWLLDVHSLLPEQDQQTIAKVYISAFLDATLKDVQPYRKLLQDHRAGRQWLPNTIYLTQYCDGRYVYISDFEEDIDTSTISLPGGSAFGAHLATWREHEICLKYGCMDTHAVYLGWANSPDSPTPSYTLNFPAGAIAVSEQSSLVFSMADAGDSTEEEKMIDLTIEVVDKEGNSAKLPLSHWSGLQPDLACCIWKSAFLDCKAPSENVYQSFVFPMKDFIKVNKNFIPSDLTTVRFLFDKTPAWEIILDDVGMRPY